MPRVRRTRLRGGPFLPVRRDHARRPERTRRVAEMTSATRRVVKNVRRSPPTDWSHAVRRALITGITGQDGSYLAELLLGKGYEVHGLIRRASTFNTVRIDHLYRDPHEPERADVPPLRRPDRRRAPHRPDARDQPRRGLQPRGPVARPRLVRRAGAHRQRDRARHHAPARGGPDVRAWSAVTTRPRARRCSAPRPPPQDENTPFYPRSPYGVAKVYGYWATRNYREAYDLFAVNGILFNHESPATRRDVRDPQDHPRGGADQGRTRRVRLHGQPRRRA